MSISELNGNERSRSPINLDEAPDERKIESPGPQAAAATPSTDGAAAPSDTNVNRFATRADASARSRSERGKLLLLGGGLLFAVTFFVFTTIVGHPPAKRKAALQPATTQSQPQQKSEPPQGSVTPLMDTVRTDVPENTDGEVRPGDIKRTRSYETGANGPSDSTGNQKPPAGKSPGGGSLGNIPSFADTQQKWEEPQPYTSSTSPSTNQAQQEQNILKESSLVFVHRQAQTQNSVLATHTHTPNEAPALDLAPGTRIQAKLETQISSAVQAPVVAVVEYTYALGDRIVVPAGARVYGHLQQADRSGYVGVKFDELETLDGARETIDAIGASLDFGPIKGNVYGKNTGKNFLARTASGIGSVAAMLVGNNTSSAFSEDDMLRQRVAENIGNAGDAQVMNLASNSRVVISVPADTKIYVVFTKHEPSPATLHKVEGSGP
jgi:type IV secretory pathway VirB10-like protein